MPNGGAMDMDKHEPLSLSRKRRIREVSDAYADCLQDSLGVCSTAELKQFAKKLGVKVGNMVVEDRIGFIKVLTQVSVILVVVCRLDLVSIPWHLLTLSTWGN